MSIGRNIAAARKAKGLTQGQLALCMGVTQGAVTGWETDKRDPKIKQLPTLCAVLDTSIEALLAPNTANDSLPHKEGENNGAGHPEYL